VKNDRGELVAWSDDLGAPGTCRFAPLCGATTDPETGAVHPAKFPTCPDAPVAYAERLGGTVAQGDTDRWVSLCAPRADQRWGSLACQRADAG
jgi:hypothetical protein